MLSGVLVATSAQVLVATSAQVLDIRGAFRVVVATRARNKANFVFFTLFSYKNSEAELRGFKLGSHT